MVFFGRIYEKGGYTIREIHVISTNRQSLEELTAILREIHPYIDFVHFREKTWTDQDMQLAINELVSCGVKRQKIIVNKRIDLAHEMEIGGLQLPYEGLNIQKTRNIGKYLRLGCSVHSVKEAINAERQGVDYLIYGHIFASNSKPDLAPRGLKKLQEVAQSTSIPVIAIGGITPENTRGVIKTGASGIAVLSGILLADDPLRAVRRYRKQMKGAS